MPDPVSAPTVFGYGSLVNRRTHDYPEAWRARVSGWRRAWRRSPERARAYLTVVPGPEDFVEGLVAVVPGESWPALDARERAYQRHDVNDLISHGAPRALDVALYAIPEGAHLDPGDDNPTVLSYIDVVVQGYLAEFGPAGVQHFFESTEGWHIPVIDDRAAPVYVRAQELSAEETSLVDAALSRLGVRRLPA